MLAAAHSHIQITQIAQGLNKLHAQGTVHGNLHPARIFIDAVFIYMFIFDFRETFA
jgi:hypothetical protein